MHPIKQLKPRKGGSSPQKALNVPLVLALLSVLFCWLLGLPSLVMGVLALRSMGRKKGSKNGFSWNKAGRFAALSGTGMGALFMIYYLLSAAFGAFVSFN